MLSATPFQHCLVTTVKKRINDNPTLQIQEIVTWCETPSLRTRSPFYRGYLGRWRPNPPQVKAQEGVPGANKPISAPGPERKALAL